MRLTLTYGNLPTPDQYEQAYADVVGTDELFSFGNDKRLGNSRLNMYELWDEIVRAHREYSDMVANEWLDGKDPEVLGSWLSSVLGCLNIEWV